MPQPALLHLPTEADYRAHYLAQYARTRVTTLHGIRVFFSADTFDHAFYESTQRNGVKDQFSAARAQRIDWIGATLTDAGSTWYQGWINRTKQYDTTRSVAVAYGDFVVVLGFRAKRTGAVVANFVTCYDADNSISKIRRSPIWDLAACRIALGV